MGERAGTAVPARDTAGKSSISNTAPICDRSSEVGAPETLRPLCGGLDDAAACSTVLRQHQRPVQAAPAPAMLPPGRAPSAGCHLVPLRPPVPRQPNVSRG